jgi:tight adherence protein B
VLIAVFTFVFVLLVVLGIYWVFAHGPELRARRDLEQRLKGDEPKRPRRLRLAKNPSGPGIGTDGQAPASIVAEALLPLQRFIDQSGIRLPASAFLMFTVWAGGLAFVALGMLTHVVLVSAVGGGLAAFVPYLWIRRARQKRLLKFEEQFPEAVDLIARALRAGHAFPTGLGMVAAEIEAPVGAEFKLLYDQQNYGLSLPEALRQFAARVPVLDARFFATAVLTQRETGGNLSGVLDNLSAVMRERFKVKRQVRVISAHGRMSAAVLSGLPPVLAIAMFVISPQNMQLLFTDPLGHNMIAGAVFLQVVGMLVIRRIVNIEY